MIIVSITGPSIGQAMRQIAQSSAYADMFELRLDVLRDRCDALYALTRKPIIATCRPKWEGGKFVGSEAKRVSQLESAANAGARFIDIELNAKKSTLREIERFAPGIIISHHRLSGRRVDIRSIYKRMRVTGADVLKFAYGAQDSADMRYAMEFLRLAARDKQRAIAIAMGEYGEASRILYKKFGGWATYAASDLEATAAPGQIPAPQLKLLYGADRISRRTKLFGVVGNPLKQSKGIYLHNPLFHQAKKDAVYCRFPVKNVRTFMQYVAPMLSGFSVTIPHKQTILNYIDKPDATATAIGAVNTVVRRTGKWIGTNTDAQGALDAIERVTLVRDKRMLIVGAGGAARAIACAARERGAEVFLTNRNEITGRKLAQEFGLEFITHRELHTLRFAIIANATSVGMTPRVNESPLLPSVLKGAVVFDAVYNPPTTQLLRDAMRVRCKVVSGMEMYLNQAALQSQLYSGTKPAASTMKNILSEAW